VIAGDGAICRPSRLVGVELDAVPEQRCKGDIHPTGLLWARRRHRRCRVRCLELRAPLGRSGGRFAGAGVESEVARCAHREKLSGTGAGPESAHTALRFGLPPGAYATALIRELFEVGGQFPSGVDTPD
jgi:hypothetical protein